MKKQNPSAASKYFKEAESKSNTELIDEIFLMTNQSSVDELDTDKVTAYLEMLDERAPIEEPLGIDEAEAWKRVLEQVEEIDPVSESSPNSPDRKIRSHRTHRVILRTLSAAVILIMALCIVAFASGVNPFETVVKWTGDLIFFARNPSGELELPEGTEAEYRSLREALDENGMEDAMCPSWIPKDYALDNIKVKQTSQQGKITAFYSSERGNIAIIITIAYSERGRNVLESEESQYDDFIVGGDVFSISSNNELIESFASIEVFDYCIAGNITLEELKTIIQSLYR